MNFKQEEIRERIYNIVLAIRTEGIVGGKTKQFSRSDTEEILSYLHSQGAVIKVERKEPFICGHAQMTAARYSQDVTCPLIVKGYVAVEPLIKEESHEEVP